MLSNRERALELAEQEANAPHDEQTELVNLLYMLEW